MPIPLLKQKKKQKQQKRGNKTNVLQALYRKPVTTIMVTLMVFIAGIVSYFNLDQALMPDMDLPIAVVMTTYVGASPEEIEELISKPMEESLGSIANVDTVTSYSSTNSSMVLLQFVDGTDIDMAAVDMRDKSPSA